MITSRDFSEWVAYSNVEPFGEERGDFRAGIIASTIANVNRNPKKHRAFKPGDFMPKFDVVQERQPWQDQLRLVEMLTKAFGGKDKRSKSGEPRDPDSPN